MASQMEWRAIPGTEYEVSESGDVRRARTLSKLRGYINTDGYLSYSIGSTHVLAHRLVAQAFLGHPEPGQNQVAHKDGSRVNCHWSNLRWSTSLDNHNDRRLHGTGPVGERNPKAKVTEADVRFIRREYQRIKRPGSGRRVAELDQAFGLHRATILDIAMRRTWQHVT